MYSDLINNKSVSYCTLASSQTIIDKFKELFKISVLVEKTNKHIYKLTIENNGKIKKSKTFL